MDFFDSEVKPLDAFSFQKMATSEPPKQSLAAQKLPPPKRQLALEIQSFERIIRNLEKEKKKDETTISIMWNEISTRMGLFDQIAGRRYTPPLEVARIQKIALTKFFLATGGHAWSNKLGWVGQPKVGTTQTL